jgi:hypothetical protein
VNLYHNGAVGFIDCLDVSVGGNQVHGGNRARHNRPMIGLLPNTKRNDRVIGPLGQSALHVGFIRLFRVNAVCASANTALAESQLTNLLDVFPTKHASVWAADLGQWIQGTGRDYVADERYQYGRARRVHRLTRKR